MEFSVIIKNSIAVLMVMGVAWASQMPWLASNTANFAYSQGVKSENSYAKEAGNWIKNHVFDKISGGVGGQIEKANDAISSAAQSAAQTVVEKKNNVIEISVSDTKKFIATEILKALGVTPQDLGATGCPAK